MPSAANASSPERRISKSGFLQAWLLQSSLPQNSQKLMRNYFCTRPAGARLPSRLKLIVPFFVQAGSHRSMTAGEDRPQPRQRVGNDPQLSDAIEWDNDGPNQFSRTCTRFHIV